MKRAKRCNRKSSLKRRRELLPDHQIRISLHRPSHCVVNGLVINVQVKELPDWDVKTNAQTRGGLGIIRHFPESVFEYDFALFIAFAPWSSRLL